MVKRSSICILGVEDSIYTKILTKKFDELGISYYLILQRKNKVKKYQRIKFFFMSRKYIALSKFDIFFYKLILKEILYRKSQKYQSIISPYLTYNSKTENVFFTNSINNKETFEYLKKKEISIGVFGGVGIVSNKIIKTFNKFCLNAHPAPLPECRGGGALENTLYQNLNPAVSIHIAEAEVDKGTLLSKRNLTLRKDDSFFHIYTKLTILCCKEMSIVLRKILDNENDFENEVIKGKLFYWKNCTKKIRKQAFRNLNKMLKQNA